MSEPLEATLVDLNNKPKAFDLRDGKEGVTKIGRRSKSDIKVDQEMVSGEHTKIEWKAPFYWLTDQSKNGTYLTHHTGPNDTMTTTKCEPGVPYQLRHFDQIVVVAEPIGHFKLILAH